MIPLRIVVVVVVVQISPPSVVMRKDGRDEEQGHVVAQLPFGQQSDQILVCLVQGDDTGHHQDPHLDRVAGGIEVHVLVGGDAALVRSLVDRVPARAGAIAFVHVPGIGLPEAPKHVDVSGQDNGRQEGTADHTDQWVRKQHLAQGLAS